MTPPPPQDQIIDKNEILLFRILLGISVVAWIGLIVGTFGIALIFLLFGFIGYLFIQSGLISYLRGTGAIISPKQFPDLHTHFSYCLARLGMENKKPPEMILIHADGMFNAMATRFLRRDYVILFSDIVDALKDDPEAIKFYIGHELGHIRRGHLIWDPILVLASWLPLMGAGYSRAREYTCDLHGLACCPDRGAAMRAMAALAVGGERWKTIDFGAYLEQVRHTDGFWMSFHEIVGSYPWLTKRIARLEGSTPVPHRNPGAWALGLLIPKLSLVSLALIYLIFIGFTILSEFKKQTDSTYAYEETLETPTLDPNTLPHPTTDAEYYALPNGAYYVDSEDGNIYRKEQYED